MTSPRQEFTAPPGRAVKILTPVTLGVVVLACAGMVVAARLAPKMPGWVLAIGLGMPVASLAVTWAFSVRGYRLEGSDTLLVLRPGRVTRLSWAGLSGAEARPDAFRSVSMKAGSAGFLGYLGWFRSRALGAFRAWVTDPDRSVLLRFPDRQIVVSPDDRAAFISAIEWHKGRRPAR